MTFSESTTRASVGHRGINIPRSQLPSKLAQKYDEFLGIAIARAERKGFHIFTLGGQPSAQPIKPDDNGITYDGLPYDGIFSELSDKPELADVPELEDKPSQAVSISSSPYMDVLEILVEESPLWRVPWKWGRWFGLRDDPHKPPALCRTQELMHLVRWCQRNRRRKTVMQK